MTIKKFLAALIFVFCSLPVFAQEWVEVAKTDQSIFFLRAASVVATENDGGARVIAAVGKAYSINSNRVEVYIWYVSITACVAERGKFFVLDSNGRPQSDHDFVFKDGRVAGTIAEILCRSGQQHFNRPSDPRKLINYRINRY